MAAGAKQAGLHCRQQGRALPSSLVRIDRDAARQGLTAEVIDLAAAPEEFRRTQPRSPGRIVLVRHS